MATQPFVSQLFSGLRVSEIEGPLFEDKCRQLSGGALSVFYQLSTYQSAGECFICHILQWNL